MIKDSIMRAEIAMGTRSSTKETTLRLPGIKFLSLILAFCTGVTTCQTALFWWDSIRTSQSRSLVTLPVVEHTPVLRNPQNQQQCRFYMAESAVAEGAGLGVFAGVGLLPNEMIGFPDICLFVTNPPKRGVNHLLSHTWSHGMFFGQFEGRDTRVACEGYGTIFNTMPRSHINTKIVSSIQQTTGGIRASMPNAGSITNHFGIHAKARDVISAGSEFTIDYYDWEFDESEYRGKKRPERSIDDLEENGWCIDHVEIRQSTITGAGRGAFVKRGLPQGSVVVPAPLEVFRDRSVFQNIQPEHLFVNYCFQPIGSDVLLYPYGPGVNLINHSSKSPNVGLRWSLNPMHQQDLMTTDKDAFWRQVRPGSLILEFVALRDLQPGEELLLDYGRTWESAWQTHVDQWVPPQDAQDRKYPEDMDETGTLRTVQEQERDPYPSNLMTICNTPDRRRKDSKHVEWQDSKREEWWWQVAYCHILDREMGDNGTFEYTVEVIFNPSNGKLTEKELAYNPKTPFQDRYVDTKVPRRAIHWIEKPYHDDEHRPNAFRQPMELPAHLAPQFWIDEAQQARN